MRCVIACLTLLLAACSGSPAASDATTAPGSLRIGVEQIDGVFVEGFQLTFVVTDPNGDEATYRWDELVTQDRLEWTSEVGPGDIERWYTGLLVLEVPPGETAITSELHLGMEPPGQPCTARFEVPADGSVEVRIALTGDLRGCPVASAARD